ncbi:MAG TPA: nucleotide disphospho-sugar-binding domain-containing protein [Gammaproteobacteria bacterium]|nr:nucleotide disphospho-sugar-binding domain-containing protein [Gammaproteobacteria bacterium]
MRVLLTPIGSLGDNLPFLGLGAELARRGHDVTVATSEHYESLVRRCGLAFIGTVTEAEYRLATGDPELFDARKGFAAVMSRVVEYNRRLFGVVEEQMRRGPLTVVAHTLDFASRAVADKTGLPVVRVHLQPSVVRTSHAVPVTRGTIDYSFLPHWTKRGLWSLVDRIMIDPALAPGVNEIRARLDLPPVRRVFVSQIDSPLLTLAMFPEWFAPRQPDWPSKLRQCGFPLFDAPGSLEMPAEAERFLADGPAPIVFTPGSAMRFAQAFFAAAVGACETLGRRGILLTSHAEQVPERLPGFAARFDYLPLSAALPRCAALVHHGGIGTTAAALAAGVPQVVVPFSHDQPDHAHRVLRLGVGRRIMPSALAKLGSDPIFRQKWGQTPFSGASRLAAELEALLRSADVARRCRDVAALCAAEDGIGRACDLIEAAVAARGEETTAPALAP